MGRFAGEANLSQSPGSVLDVLTIFIDEGVKVFFDK